MTAFHSERWDRWDRWGQLGEHGHWTAGAWHRRHSGMKHARRMIRHLPVPLPLLIAGALLFTGAAITAVMTLLVLVVSALVIAGSVAAFVLGSVQIARHFSPAVDRALACGRSQRRERCGGRRQESHGSESLAFTDETPVDLLRRRYAAGDIGQRQFRDGLVELLKERYVRGDLTMAEFEARVTHVLQDPALRSPQ